MESVYRPKEQKEETNVEEEDKDNGEESSQECSSDSYSSEKEI
jgi:hypothetical protein